ncbi:MAG: ATP synthase F1 subunit delta [Thermodesulfobacteriota bacterium]
MATIATLNDLVDALTETGLENNNLETVILNMKEFFELLSESEDLKNVLATDAFEDKERQGVISDICQNAGILDETKNFLILASEFDKFGALLNTKDSVIRKLELAAGKLKAEITSANSLTENELNRIKESLNRATGKEVDISISIDPSILGGLITKIGDKVFDNSIKTQLEKIQGILNP